MKQLLIIPDVHGRTFWRDKVYDIIENDEETHIVFLGDYLDPYTYEGIFPQDAIPIFKEIIDLKKRCPKQITLLLGNHDCGYIWSNVCSCRRDKKNYNEISKLFNDNLNLFDLAYKEGRYLFTHAGVHKRWFDLVFGENSEYYPNIDTWLNNWLHVDQGNIADCLEMYSCFRGYVDSWYGSCVWADVREWSWDVQNQSERNKELGYFQIFGHTQLELDPIIKNDFACIDCRRYFILKDDKLIDEQYPMGGWTWDLNKE